MLVKAPPTLRPKRGQRMTLYAAWSPKHGLDYYGCPGIEDSDLEYSPHCACIYESEGAAMAALVTNGWADGGQVFPVIVEVPGRAEP